MTADDVLLASYPRSGSTWLRFLLFEYLTGQPARFGRMKSAIPSVGKHREAEETVGTGRIVQTHERRGAEWKALYVVRDVRDVALSEHAWQRRLQMDPGTFDNFLSSFLRGRSTPWGPWDAHVDYWLGGTEARPAHLAVRYEELRRDPESAFAEVIRFLGPPWDGDRARGVIESNSLEQMRTKEDEARAGGWRPDTLAGTRFVNRGKAGGWEERLSPRQVARIEERFGETLERLGYELRSG